MSNRRILAEEPVSRDREEQAAILTLLVALHLLVFAETGSWLTPAQVVVAMRQWKRADSNVLDILRRVALSSLALPLSLRIAESFPCLLDVSRMESAFMGRLQPGSHEYRLIKQCCDSAITAGSCHR